VIASQGTPDCYLIDTRATRSKEHSGTREGTMLMTDKRLKDTGRHGDGGRGSISPDARHLVHSSWRLERSISKRKRVLCL